jgi:hypothetical protein
MGQGYDGIVGIPVNAAACLHATLVSKLNHDLMDSMRELVFHFEIDICKQ